jgi:uncharacterized membrane protein
MKDPRRVMAIAVLSVVAGLSAVYLHLYKLGVLGTLACSTGGCDRAMFSRWGWFLGVDVALIGVVGYACLIAAFTIALQPRWQEALWPARLLLVLAAGGFVFTLRLKYGEFMVLHTFCPWCAISAVCITVILILAWFEWRGRARAAR